MKWCLLILRYLKVLTWPCVLLFFMFYYSAEISTFVKNLSEAEKVQLGSLGFERKIIAEYEREVREKEEKGVPPEKTFAVVKAIKDFQGVLVRAKKSELNNYFSKHYPDRQKNIEKWGQLLGKEISIEVRDIGQYGDKIKASIKVTIEGIEIEDSATLIKEDGRWQFLD